MSIDYCHYCDVYVDTDENTDHVDCENETDAEVEKTDTLRDLQAPNWPRI